MFCKDDIIDTIESKPSVTAKSECITAGYVKVSKRVKSYKAIETGKRDPCIWAYVLIENNKKLFLNDSLKLTSNKEPRWVRT